MSGERKPNFSDAEPPPRLHHDDYTVAIMCPMGDELSPVIALFDERHENLVTSRDQNAYELGRIGQHHVVVAAMPMIGNNAAATVITQLINDFCRIRFGLLVGVGGGIPDEDYKDDDLNDVRLGDVVVSESRGGFGGVVQFDRGKSTTTGFVRTGHLNKPPHVLASNVEKLKATHNLYGHSIPRYVDEMLGKYPHMEEKYSYPGIDRDHLFEASYQHVSGKSCKKCDITQIVTRNPRKNVHPRIHYGTIGSSNMVIEDTQKRDELRDMGILCIEMEAAGLVDAFPCLIIRGISDYADSHKNKRWQPYAAMTAAAYTKELLLQIPLDAVTHIQTITDILYGLSTKIDQVDSHTTRIDRRAKSAEETKTLEWLSPNNINFSSLQNVSQQTHTAGTGQWFLDDERYRDWRDTKPGLLWLKGAAGCGKTILCSTIIKNLQEHGLNPAYWYFRFDHITSQDVSKMLRSIIRQLSFFPLPVAIQALLDRHNQHASEPSLEELITALNHIFEIFDGDIFIVLDALDECPNADKDRTRDQLLHCIKCLVTNGPSNLHLLVTSRPEPDIQRELGSVASYSFDIERLIKCDVEKHVELALEGYRLASWTTDVKDQIRKRLLGFEERRFRWADLQLKRFALCPTLERLRAALNSIPKDLEAAYRQVFDTIDGDDKGDVVKIMMWLAVSFKPLNADQIAAVVGFRSPDYVLEICSTLLVTIIDEGTTQIIKLAHFSVKEFLIVKHYENSTQWYRFSTTQANSNVAFIALQALLEPEHQTKLILPYAAKYWPQHATEGLKERNATKLEEQIGLLFDSFHTEQFHDWLKIHDPEKMYDSKLYRRAGPLYYASLLGFDTIVRRLWVDCQPLRTEGRYGSALNAAAVNGNVATVHWIMQNCNSPAKFSDLVVVAGEIKANAMECIAELCNKIPNLKITDDVVKAAAWNAGSGKDVMAFLLEERPDDVVITKDTVSIIANRFDSSIMSLLLEKRPDVVITEKVVGAAAGNYDSGRDVMALLLEQRPDEVVITEEVVKVAAENYDTGRDVMLLLLEKRPHTFLITEEVVSIIAHRFDSSIMSLLLEKTPDDVITEQVVMAVAGNSGSGRDVMLLLLRKRPSDVKITEKVVIAAAGNSGSGRDVMALLLEQRPDEVVITEDVVKAAAWNAGSGRDVMALLLEKRPDNVVITEKVAKAAAGNHGSGRDVMALLLEKGSDNIAITENAIITIANEFDISIMSLLLEKRLEEVLTEKVVKAALENYKGGRDVIALLLQKRPDDIVITNEVVSIIAHRFDSSIMSLLLEKRPNDVVITEQVVMAVAGNSGSGRDVMALLLEQRPDEVVITEDVVKAAAWNAGSGRNIMALLLGKRPREILITEKMVSTIAYRFDGSIMSLLLEKRPDVVITEKVVSAAAGNSRSGRDVVALLLKTRPNNIVIIEEIVIAAAGNSGSGRDVMLLLLGKRPNDVKITEKVVIAAAGNSGSGRDVMALLLNKRPREVLITEEVVIAAAGNCWNGKDVMALLLEKGPDNVAITEDAIIAIANRFDISIISYLLEYRPQNVVLTEKMVKAVAGNFGNKGDIIALLLEEGPDNVAITEGAVSIIANRFDSSTMSLLLEKKSDDILITKEVVKAAVLNSWSGRDMVAFLLEQRPDEIVITEEVVIAAAGNSGSGRDVMALLLDKRPREVLITEEVVIAAAWNAGSGRDVMALLLKTRPDDVKITARVVMAAAGNSRSGRDVMALLLEKRPREVLIMEEVVKAAAANLYGEDVIASLLASKGH